MKMNFLKAEYIYPSVIPYNIFLGGIGRNFCLGGQLSVYLTKIKSQLILLFKLFFATIYGFHCTFWYYS